MIRRQRVHTLLIWLTFSLRPLLLDEAAELFAFECNGSCLLDFDPRRRALEPRDILSICPGLVTVAQHDRCKPENSGGQLILRLVHASVKDYLLASGTNGPAKWYGIDKSKADCFIAATCLHYLLQLDSPDAITCRLQTEYPLARYASQYWPSHALLSRVTEPAFSPLQELMEDVFLIRPTVFRNWIRIHDPDEPWRTQEKPLDESFAPFIPSPLYIASLTGLDTVVSCILSNEPEISSAEGIYGSALHAAAGKGFSRVVTLLLDFGVPANTLGLYGTALHTAAYEGQTAVCHILLDRGADVNAGCEEFGNALEAAIYGGHEEVVQLLLHRGADPTAPGRHHVDSLNTACWVGNTDIVRLLLDNNLDKGQIINPLARSYNLALQISSDRGFTEISALLRTHWPSPQTTRDEVYGAALHASVAHGHARIVELLLLDQTPAINVVEDEEHGTPLCLASSTGNEEIVRLLLRNGADPTIQSTAGTPLHIASSLGHLKTVQLLLEHRPRVDIDAVGGHFGTPLQAACYKGNTSIARLLLQSGADARLTGVGRYGSALHAAVGGLAAQVETAQLLLEHGADANALTEEFGTPVQLALSCGNSQAARLLQRYGGLGDSPGGV